MAVSAKVDGKTVGHALPAVEDEVKFAVTLRRLVRIGKNANGKPAPNRDVSSCPPGASVSTA
jgi:hypothetical protein